MGCLPKDYTCLPYLKDITTLCSHMPWTANSILAHHATRFYEYQVCPTCQKHYVGICRKGTKACFQCDNPGYFVMVCPRHSINCHQYKPTTLFYEHDSVELYDYPLYSSHPFISYDVVDVCVSPQTRFSHQIQDRKYRQCLEAYSWERVIAPAYQCTTIMFLFYFYNITYAIVGNMPCREAQLVLQNKDEVSK